MKTYAECLVVPEDLMSDQPITAEELTAALGRLRLQRGDFLVIRGSSRRRCAEIAHELIAANERNPRQFSVPIILLQAGLDVEAMSRPQMEELRDQIEKALREDHDAP